MTRNSESVLSTSLKGEGRRSRKRRIILLVVGLLVGLVVFSAVLLMLIWPAAPTTAERAAEMLMTESFYWMDEDTQNAYLTQARDLMLDANSTELDRIREQYGEIPGELIMAWDSGQRAQEFASAVAEQRVQLVDGFISDYQITREQLDAWDAEMEQAARTVDEADWDQWSRYYSPQQQAMDTVFWDAVDKRVGRD